MFFFTALLPVLGYLSSAAVPAAMSTFGTVVSGVGTLHAAGGVAATLQAVGAATTTGLLAKGMLMDGVVAVAFVLRYCGAALFA